MSFDVYIAAYNKGEAVWYPRAIVESAFSALAMGDRSQEILQLILPDGQKAGSMYIDPTLEVSGFAIDRPSGHPVFWNAILDVLRQTPSVLFWPGVGPHPRACVVQSSVIPELPLDMIESVGYPTIVNSPDEINHCISVT